jgi:hypothetical protein
VSREIHWVDSPSAGSRWRLRNHSKEGPAPLSIDYASRACQRTDFKVQEVPDRVAMPEIEYGGKFPVERLNLQTAFS